MDLYEHGYFQALQDVGAYMASLAKNLELRNEPAVAKAFEIAGSCLVRDLAHLGQRLNRKEGDLVLQ